MMSIAKENVSTKWNKNHWRLFESLQPQDNIGMYYNEYGE
jgi:hypothetical protein